MIKNILTIVFLLVFNQVNGQNIKDNIGVEDALKPNSSKGKVGSNMVNVDLYTGTGSVNIPLYQYATNGLNLGVSLGYVAKGIRVDEIASSVGLGWNLNAGGSITREVNGLEDEVTLPVTYVNASTDSLQGYLVPGATIDPNNITPNDDDKEHDLFTFNLGGRSIEVSFSYHSGVLVWQTYPRSELQIELITKDVSSPGYTNVRSGIKKKTAIDQTHDILTFNVIDEQGNKFFFERGDYLFKHFEFSPGTFNNTGSYADSGTYYPTQKWDLKKVITYSGLEINYNYISKYVEYTENVTETLYPKTYGFDTSSIPIYDPFQIKEQKWKGIKTHLASISYPNNDTVTFDLDTAVNHARCDCQTNYRLKGITVESRHDNHVNTHISYVFDQAYFNSANYGLTSAEVSLPLYCSIIGAALTIPSRYDSDSAKEMHLSRGLRLKLKGITRKGTDNSTQENFYSFGYNTTALPYRFSPSKDYYGYYNGKTDYPFVKINYATGNRDTFHTSVPYHHEPGDSYSGFPGTIISTDWGVDKSQDIAYTPACVLTKIKNCSDGYDSLIYGGFKATNPSCSYSYLSEVPDPWCNCAIGCDVDTLIEGDTVNDGLCISKVLSIDPYNIQHTTTTEYTFDTAQRFNRGGYCWFPDVGDLSKKGYTNFFVGTNSYVNGSNHGFSKVTVTVKGYIGQQLSKSKYYFSNLMYQDDTLGWHSCMRKPTGLVRHNVHGELTKYRMGLPLKVENYDENNTLVSKTENTFEYGAHWLNDIVNVRFFKQDSYYWAYHVIDYEKMRMVSTTSSQYIGAKAFTTTTNYQYDDSDNVKMVAWNDSKGNLFKKYIKYNYDYHGTFGSVHPLALARMNSWQVQHILSNEVWKMNGTNDSALISLELVSPVVQHYANDTVLYFPAKFATEIKQPLSASDASSTSIIYRRNAIDFGNYSTWGSNFKKQSEITLYDSKLNALETKINDQDDYGSCIWDTVTGHKLAEVANAKYSDIAYSSFEGVYKAINTDDYNKGNLNFEPQAVIYDTGALTGKYVLELEQGGYSTIESKPLDTITYILSFWIKTTSGGFDVGLTDGSSMTGTVNMNLQDTVGAWKLYTGTFRPGLGDYVQIIEPNLMTPATTYIDEIRLHPAGALMSSYTYIPLFGVGSVTDARNHISYYEYDPLGRLTIQRNMRGKIVKKIEMVCGQIISNDGAGPVSDPPPDL